ncbi:MAG: Tad domain-containing protein [Myxococcales bacterium]|nr:Tad domain-containing protein [Myxococcales bacterium]
MRRGNAATVAVCLVGLLGFGSVVVDIGIVVLAETQLQVTLDSAALAAAGTLDGTDAGIVAARRAAADIAGQHTVLGAAVTLTADDLVFGAFGEEGFVVSSVAQEIDAAQVSVDGVPVSLTLSGVSFGLSEVDAEASSIARRPAGGGSLASTQCYLPLAIPDCVLDDVTAGSQPAPMKFTFTPTPSDNVAWGRPDGQPNTNWIRNQLEDGCSDEPIVVGEWMDPSEGAHNDALHTVRDILNNTESTSPDPWIDAAPMPARDGVSANVPTDSEIWAPNFGNVIQGPVALVDAGDCGSTSFKQDLKITGISWGAIYDVQSKGGGGRNGSQKNLWLQLDVLTDYSSWGETTEEGVGNVTGRGTPQLEMM